MRENFGSKIGAVLAAAGSAVGLGNIWRFPIETGRGGGAAFVLIYLGCVLLLGLPVMLSEFMIGRHTRANTARAYQKLAPGSRWKWVGRLGVATGFMILSYYSVVAGWTLHYAFLSATCGFKGKGTEDYPALFSSFSSSTWLPLMWMALFILVTHRVVSRGVKGGIERWSKLLMPALFVMVAVLVGCAVSLPGAGEGLTFLLKPDFSRVDSLTVLSAMGQAFFSLSLGMGCLCTYASYFTRHTNLMGTALKVISIDTLIALMAGFIIFPAAASAHYSLSSGDIGPSLIFITLPGVFQQAFGGAPLLSWVFSTLFYLLLMVAALTSAISMHEVVTSYLSEEFSLTRRRAALLETVSCLLLGVVCSLSFGLLSDLKLAGMTVFDLFDFVASNIAMPLGGVLISLFAGWRLSRKAIMDEMTNGGTLRAPWVRTLIFLLRWIVPLIILIMVAHQLYSGL